MKNLVELKPVDNRKSFYGKALIGAENGRDVLYSYGVNVCAYDRKAGTFTRIWDGYSFTTMRHINAFCAFCGIDGGGKTWWDKLEVGTPYNVETWKPAASVTVAAFLPPVLPAMA